MPWKPHNGAQDEFYSRGELEVLYGGAAGPGRGLLTIRVKIGHISVYRHSNQL